jgi:hypothetical protein
MYCTRVNYTYNTGRSEKTLHASARYYETAGAGWGHLDSLENNITVHTVTLVQVRERKREEEQEESRGNTNLGSFSFGFNSENARLIREAYSR